MESALDHEAARALLEWQVELGATEAIGDLPVDRYALPDTVTPERTRAAPPAPAAPVTSDSEDPVAIARDLAAAAGSLADLRAAMDGFTLCDLRKGARNLVFADGVAGAPVMIIGEAPGRDEDREGRPFVGRAGQMLDRMLAAIGLSRAENVYITNVLPWRPPQNRDPKPDEIGMMTPFLERHVALARPSVLILMGNISCQAVLGKRGITRLRGGWAQAMDLPVLPMFHPAYLLRQPAMKRLAWADLLELNAKLRAG
ncbi:DNA polymerase [Cribrihabitans marinus]|uniref:Type-4 uracil-DNA glycosylase n=1 Tax=Cribrihabitans marinus TaxID=1227549 RepID=A0A1H7CCN5_9RHOB|nr:uracil-DNA glycosylase [Cribrihabitans marinus]GGH35072.1 uracil-DNA glycosylase [Cribrihabitans marinus]SEJ87226.1 DNA polymerase [Cribrihabitans marinus]